MREKLPSISAERALECGMEIEKFIFLTQQAKRLRMTKVLLQFPSVMWEGTPPATGQIVVE
jgi:hypothetical protein